MIIVRNKSKEKYTVVDNNIFKNKELSLKARGMITTLLSLPDNWEFSENGLEHIFNDGLTTIKSSLKELEKNGYLVRKQVRDNKGRFLKNDWTIYEIPLLEKPLVEKPTTDKPITENDTQLNTNILNTNNINICPSDDEQVKSSSIEKELAENFEKIWNLYPRKEGKNSAFNHYKAWLKGKKYAGKTVKLTNRQMWFATKKYANSIEKNKTERQYVKMGSTFFNEAIMEYVEEDKDL